MKTSTKLLITFGAATLVVIFLIAIFVSTAA
jgi:hypothetical protein